MTRRRKEFRLVREVTIENGLYWPLGLGAKMGLESGYCTNEQNLGKPKMAFRLGGCLFMSYDSLSIHHLDGF
jgi:hypothetical protein